ncbi:MAG: hypothetical protein HQL71_10405, partial [Magnetococcales bacterium]|nr:hypothetical protein [Magnetococcales bacterium]
MKIIFHISITLILLVLSGCSTKHLDNAWSQGKKASYNAITDPVTWGSAIAATTLYITKADDEITDYFMDHDYFYTESGETFTHINEAITLTTALAVPDDKLETKAKRFMVENAAYAISRQSTDMLNSNIHKESPNGRTNAAIGSHHAISPFAGAAMTRRNVAQMDIPNWAKNGIVGTNYV